MVTIPEFRQWALSLKDSEEKPHFDLLSFRVRNKIFATLHEKKNLAMLKFSPETQSVFCSFGKNVFFPVPGGWGAKGATFVDLAKVRKDMFRDALKTAYQELTDKLPKR